MLCKAKLKVATLVETEWNHCSTGVVCYVSHSCVLSHTMDKVSSRTDVRNSIRWKDIEHTVASKLSKIRSYSSKTGVSRTSVVEGTDKKNASV